MLMRMVYDEKLAAASYLFGCQKSGEAIVIDPERDVDRYLALAKKEGLRIVAAAETHIHADFLSGVRELAERAGARAYLSGEGGAEWAYAWPALKSGATGAPYDHRLLKHNDTFSIGGIEFRALHTPGHTPEHLCFLVTDRGSGATEPMGLISGDFVFVGDLGRPDLLESAAGRMGAAEPAAHSLFASVREFLKLPDYLQVWPAHGAGSACGKALGAVPQTTVGYERRFNPSLLASKSEDGFVRSILQGQPDPPVYFARMKRDNRDGPAVLGNLPRPRELDAHGLGLIDARRAAVIDTRPWSAFRSGHVPGALFHPLNSSFTTDVGSMVRENEAITLIIDPARVDEAVRDLVRIGLDRVESFVDASKFEAYLREAGKGKVAQAPETDAAGARPRIEAGEVFVLDVRRASEFAEGHIKGATNIAHTRLDANLERVPRDRPVLVHCRSGGRSARATALLRKHGYDAINLAGGFDGWAAAGAPVAR